MARELLELRRENTDYRKMLAEIDNVRDERDNARGEAKAAEANADRKNKLISELQRQLSFADPLIVMAVRSVSELRSIVIAPLA